MARVALNQVRKMFAGVTRPAVEDVTLEVGHGEFVVLVGPSGCGKSTTLRMIAGLEETTSGEIVIGERRVNDVHPKDRDIAMVFQNYALYPHLNVYKNMAFGLLLRKFPKAEIDARVREAAEILGLTEYLDRKPKALSGGQRQRVAVGRAIVRRPQVFLFDEPLSNLDAKMRVQMRTEISRLHHRLGATMIYVTHDQVEAMTMGDRIVVMNLGRVQQVGPPLEIYERPANRFVAGFIGSPQMNFIEGELIEAEDGGRLFFKEAGGEAKLEVWAGHRVALGGYGGRKVTLGVRPEDFKEASAASGLEGPGESGIGMAGTTGEGAQAGGWRELAARVDVVEPMGSEVYWYLKTGAHALVARLEPHAKATAGEEKRLAVNLAKAHYFDPKSEACIV